MVIAFALYAIGFGIAVVFSVFDVAAVCVVATANVLVVPASAIVSCNPVGDVVGAVAPALPWGAIALRGK